MGSCLLGTFVFVPLNEAEKRYTIFTKLIKSDRDGIVYESGALF